METDERLDILCEEFADLEEPEKDYILKISLVLASSISLKNNESLKTNASQEYLA